jgi:hypothetical protein
MGLFSKLFGRKKKDEEFLSIVYLLRRHRKADEPKLRAALAGLIQRVFKMDAPPETHVKQVSESGAGLVIAGQPFVVIGVGEPYTTDDPAQITPDLRKRNLLKEHTAWLACDWMLPVTGDEDRQAAYRLMGLIMATVAILLKGDVIAVLDKQTGRLVPYSDNVPDRLTGDFPESVFEEYAPILSGDGLEEELQKAADEAQSRLPEFVSHWSGGRRAPRTASRPGLRRATRSSGCGSTSNTSPTTASKAGSTTTPGNSRTSRPVIELP